MKQAYRHGDVVIVPLDGDAFEELETIGYGGGGDEMVVNSLVLAEGEITGHSHQLSGTEEAVIRMLDFEGVASANWSWRRENDNKRVMNPFDTTDSKDDLTVRNLREFGGKVFEITEEMTLTHEEHETITLPPGQYVSYSQREHWGGPEGQSRRVLD